jgi:cytochrome c oxidase subunit II
MTAFSSMILAIAAGHAQHAQSALKPLGSQAGEIEKLWWLMFWICLVAYVLTIAFLSRAISRTQVPAPVELLPNDPHKDWRLSQVVGVSTGMVAVILFVLLFVSVATGKRMGGLQSKNAVTIEVIGHQWWWEVRYPNTQADLTVTTANEIHIPVGMPVVVHTSSHDVIHSFWAPNLQGKRDLIPGHRSALWFQSNKVGRVRGQCAEFCGHQHAHMAFFIVTETQEAFQAWLDQQRKPASPPVTAEQQRGKDLFERSTCAMCHTVRGTVAGSRVGPDLTHLASRSTIGAGTLPNTQSNLSRWVRDSQAIKPGNLMPPHNLSANDLNDIVKYLESLR